MPKICSFDLGLNGLEPDAVGLPTRLEVYAHVQGSCDRVRLTVRQHQGGASIFSAEVSPDSVSPDSNGTCKARFPLPTAIFPCGFELWVEASCVEAGNCFKGEMLPISCKGPPGAGGEDPGDSSPPGGGDESGSNDEWPWPLPPLQFCPLMGRSFTIALLLGLMTLVASVALLAPAGIAAAGVIIAGAFAILGVWLHWCTVSFCNLWGAILWALKRAVTASVLVVLFTASIPVLLLSLTMGIAAGVITAKLRSMRCRLPAHTTPLQELPLW
jgi:hypothetical protein